MKRFLFKILVVFFLLFGNNAFAQLKEPKDLFKFDIDTMNLTAKVLDSISPSMFHGDNDGYMDIFWTEQCRFEIIAGEDSSIFHKIISANIQSWNRNLKYSITKGWVGNIIVIRTRIDSPPFALYLLNYVCKPGEFFITSHNLYHFH